MKFIALILIIMFILPITAYGLELEPPAVPEIGEKYIPQETESFAQGLIYMLKVALKDIAPSIKEASSVCLSLVCIVILVSILNSFSGISSNTVTLSSVVMVALLLLSPSNSLINLASNTVRELSDYGKLLLPIMTTAMAVQGGTASSSALYSGSVLFCSLLTSLLSGLIVPLIYIHMCLCVASSVVEENVIKELKKFSKWLITWSMKITLYVFSGYMSITKIVTGAVDAAALRATKLTISGMIPMVGKLISDSSETILVSAGIVKNSIGIYGFLAVLAVLIGPIIKIGAQYLLLKLTGSICGVFGVKKTSGLIVEFSTGLSMLLGMIGSMGLMLLVSIVCFMKGVN